MANTVCIQSEQKSHITFMWYLPRPRPSPLIWPPSVASWGLSLSHHTFRERSNARAGDACNVCGCLHLYYPAFNARTLIGAISWRAILQLWKRFPFHSNRLICCIQFALSVAIGAGAVWCIITSEVMDRNWTFISYAHCVQCVVYVLYATNYGLSFAHTFVVSEWGARNAFLSHCQWNLLWAIDAFSLGLRSKKGNKI